MRNTYTNRGNKKIVPVFTFTNFPFFNHVNQRTEKGYPVKIPVSDTAIFNVPFVSLDSKVTNTLFFIIQN